MRFRKDWEMNKIVCWLSAGVSSFIAGYLCKDIVTDYIYIDVADQHPDSMRFIKDCEKFLGKEIQILKSPYETVENAILGASVITLPNGYAPCTNYLKKRVRKEWEFQYKDDDITYIWGFDVEEKHRAERLVETQKDYKHLFPLIEKQLTKQEVHGMCEQLGIKRPMMYDLGYNNNNCVGCVKGGMVYWNKIRIDFPDVFESRAKLERRLNSSILKECYLDELEPTRGRMSEEIMQECDIFCQFNL